MNLVKGFYPTSVYSGLSVLVLSTVHVNPKFQVYRFLQMYHEFLDIFLIDKIGTEVHIIRGTQYFLS